MNELDKITQKEQKLKEKQQALKAKKKQALEKEYAKIGKQFYKASKAKSFDSAKNMIDHVPMFSSTEKANPQMSKSDFATLRKFADELTFVDGANYWRTNDIKNLTSFLSKFRTENEKE